MVKVRISETYDLSTEVDKMGVIGIHTPSREALTKMYPGLFLNYRYMRLVGCDVTVACASMLPADPLQIGTEAGEIAPQDMFNPILYKAVSNDSFSTLQSRIYQSQPIGMLGSVGKADFDNSDLDQFDLYYSLLSDADGWRKAMPQSGLQMTGLYPIVYQVINNYGNTAYPNPGTQTNMVKIPTVDSDGVNITPRNQASIFRGPSLRMPRLPTLLDTFVNYTNALDDIEAKANAFPNTYVACIITPPAKLNKLYYRMKITWTVEFEEVRPITEQMSSISIAQAGNFVYASDYADQSSRMTALSDSVDADSVDIQKVMVSSV